MPFLRSFVVATSVVSPACGGETRPPSEGEQFPRGRGEQFSGYRSPGAGTHHQGVLNPDAALARKINPWLDGDGDPVGQSTCLVVPDDRRLVDLQADTVAEAVREMPAVAAPLDQVAGRPVHV